jgi:hypothetical protein
VDQILPDASVPPGSGDLTSTKIYTIGALGSPIERKWQPSVGKRPSATRIAAVAAGLAKESDRLSWEATPRLLEGRAIRGHRARPTGVGVR